MGASGGYALTGIKAKGFTCDATLPSGAATSFPIAVHSQSVQILCERTEPTTKIVDNVEYEYVPGGIITIQSASDPFMLSFVEEYTPPAPLGAVAELNAKIDTLERAKTLREVYYETLDFTVPVVLPQDRYLKTIPCNGGGVAVGSGYDTNSADLVMTGLSVSSPDRGAITFEFRNIKVSPTVATEVHVWVACTK